MNTEPRGRATQVLERDNPLRNMDILVASTTCLRGWKWQWKIKAA